MPDDRGYCDNIVTRIFGFCLELIQFFSGLRTTNIVPNEEEEEPNTLKNNEITLVTAAA